LDIEPGAIIFVYPFPGRKKRSESVPQRKVITPKPEIVSPDSVEFLRNIFIIPFKEK
jgi:hypothetical protein